MLKAAGQIVLHLPRPLLKEEEQLDVCQKMSKIPRLFAFHIMFLTPAHCLRELEVTAWFLLAGVNHQFPQLVPPAFILFLSIPTKKINSIILVTQLDRKT